MEKVLVPSKKISQKVAVPSVEGSKKSMSCIITLYSHCAGAAICNDQRSLPLAAGGLGGAVSPPAGPGQRPGGGPEGSPWKLWIPCILQDQSKFYRISLKLILCF